MSWCQREGVVILGMSLHRCVEGIGGQDGRPHADSYEVANPLSETVYVRPPMAALWVTDEIVCHNMANYGADEGCWALANW